MNRIVIIKIIILLIYLHLTMIVGCQHQPAPYSPTQEATSVPEPASTQEPISLPELITTHEPAPMPELGLTLEPAPASEQISTTELTPATTNATMPTIAFTRWNPSAFEERIFLINFDGTGLKQLTSGDKVQEHFHCISPDGSKIAFSLRPRAEPFVDKAGDHR